MAESSKNLIAAYVDMLRILECPVCYTYGSTKPASHRLCPEGHIVCDLCAKKMEQCPLCKNQFSTIRTRIFDQIREAIIYPCRKVGCGTMVPLKDLDAHEETCALLEEELGDYKKNDVIVHNIHKHLEENFSVFFTRPQEETLELLCIKCLHLLDLDAPTDSNQEKGYDPANEIRQSKLDKLEHNCPAATDFTEPAINNIGILSPSTSHSQSLGSGKKNLRSTLLECDSGEEAAGVDTVDKNESSNPHKEIESSYALICQECGSIGKQKQHRNAIFVFLS